MSLTSYRTAPPRAKNHKHQPSENAVAQCYGGKMNNKVSEKYMWLEDQATTYSPVP